MMDFAERDALVEEEPGTCNVKEHYVGYPCVVVRLDHIGSDALRDLLTGAYRDVSQKTASKSNSGARRRAPRRSSRR